MDDKFRKPYDPTSTEPRIYDAWEKSGYFNPDNLPLRLDAQGKPAERTEAFSIVLPPPNVTGILHMGSALMLAIEDSFVRFERMRGKKVLWIPGTDSAAIATQARVEKDIEKKEKKSRYDLGRDELLRRIEAFVEENKNSIVSQLRAMGASLDWSRYAYTMDEPRYKAVMEAFIRMYNAGLIYRDFRIVNWDPKGQTTIADDEIEYEERATTLYTFRYSKDFPIAIATTRPETKVGDVAVAVHPDDERYRTLIGKEYKIASFCDVPLTIKIVADKEVDPAFGTGAVGVTPAHSQTDWDIAERHSLEHKTVIDEKARITVDGRLNSKKVVEARELVAAWLRDEGLLEKEEKITHNVATAQRTGGVIEPLPKLQWWVRVNEPIAERGGKSLKELMREAVSSGSVSFITEHYERVYFNWIDNLRDWCISRQIWFGHRIPVWYKGEELKVQVDSPGDGWTQDEDVLDTWFSSGLWTFSTLGWPEQTSDLKTYHPTALIETGYDILFFWIARMILMSEFLLGETPFAKVYLHGLVRDKTGQKISKSLGNNIDPLDMAKKYGTDAVRVALIAGIAPGTDSKISEDKIRGYKHFSNKLWNITRFVLENTEEVGIGGIVRTDADVVEEAKRVIAEATKQLESYRIDLAFEALYQFVWYRFADEIVEESKSILRGNDATRAQSRAAALMESLTLVLTALHPFMPFITEEIWQSLPNHSDMLMVEAWPR